MKKTVVNYLFWYCVYLCSFLVIRNKRRYTFGGSSGSFKDNAKYLYLYACERCEGVDAAWVTASRATERRLRGMGLKVYHRRSAKGIWHALTSRYWFYNSSTLDIDFFLSGGATCVNLWHGVGTKCIQYAITKGVYAQPYQRPTLRDRFWYPYRYRKHEYVLSSTPLATEFFSRSFRVAKERCLELGYPRNSILTADEAERMRLVRRYEPKGMMELMGRMRQYGRVLLYMPTWRDSQRTLFTQHLDLDRLNEVLAAQGELMLLKPHPMVFADEIEVGKTYSNLIFLDSMMDVYPLLPYVQVLVTDYSSVLYDFLLMEDKEAFLYIYDYEEYVAERDFFFPFDEYVTGNRAKNFEEFLRIVEQHDYAIDPAERERLLQAFWGETARYDSSQRIIEYFLG